MEAVRGNRLRVSVMHLVRGRREAAAGVAPLAATRERRPDARLRVALAAALCLALFGCADCPYYDGVRSPTGFVSSPARAAAARSARPASRPESARQAAAAAPSPILKPRNQARFAVALNMEAVGRSRSYTGEPSDPNSCAERCLASSGCDAFSFEREARLCILVTQVTELTANASFVSGRLK
jgi:hypothetical protein